MDYRVCRNPHELNSTGYIEVGPGRYSGQHWREGFLFVWADAFGLAEGIVAKHFLAYDHLSMNDIPSSVGRKIAEEWRVVAPRLESMKPAEIRSVLNLPDYYSHIDNELASRKTEIASMLNELAHSVDDFSSRGDWLCILGL